MKNRLGVTSDNDLIELAGVLGFPLKVVSSDETPNLNPNEIKNLIVNVDPTYSGKNGTHWVAINISPERLTYFDPFGMIPQPDVMKFINKVKQTGLKAIMIDNQSQDIKADSCGWWCCFFLYKINSEPLSKFISKLSMDPKKNETMLRNFYQSILN